MGNCAGYCNGTGDGDDPGQIRQSFNQKDLQNQHNDFEKRYGKLSNLLNLLKATEMTMLRTGRHSGFEKMPTHLKKSTKMVA